MIIPTSRQLWNYLLHGQRNSSRKLSRVDAFRDILERQHTALLSGRDDAICASISELSKAWHWNRDTTSVYIDTLQQLGVVTVDTDGNRKSVKLNCITLPPTDSGASEKPSDAKTPSFTTKGT